MSKLAALPRKSLYRDLPKKEANAYNNAAQKLSNASDLLKKEADTLIKKEADKISLPKNCASVDDVIDETVALWRSLNLRK